MRRIRLHFTTYMNINCAYSQDSLQRVRFDCGMYESPIYRLRVSHLHHVIQKN